MWPLLAGEVVNADQKGACASMNKIIDQLPQTIPTAHVISSAGCEAIPPDHLHFTPAGYREFGTRYAGTMLALLGYKTAIESPSVSSSQPSSVSQPAFQFGDGPDPHQGWAGHAVQGFARSGSRIRVLWAVMSLSAIPRSPSPAPRSGAVLERTLRDGFV